jgi:hypothetical protein
MVVISSNGRYRQCFRGRIRLTVCSELIVVACLRRAITQAGRLAATMITSHHILVRDFYYELYDTLNVYRKLGFEESVTPIRSTCRDEL